MRVLIAIDEPSCAREAVKFALAHEWGAEAEFSLVHIIAPTTMDTPLASYPLFLESISEEAQASARKILNDTAKELTSKLDIKISCDVLIGYPTHVIIDRAKDWKADVIILGSHGRRGISRFFYGSISSEVASQAPCSVVILQIKALAEDATEPVTTQHSVATA